MKKEFLEALGLSEEQINSIMTEHEKDITQVSTKLIAAETERDTYKEQLEEAHTTIAGYKEMDIEGIKQSISTLQEKYNQDTESLRVQLEEQKKDFVLKEYVNTFAFTSELAKEAVIHQLKTKGFKLDGEKLLGADEFMNQLKEANPSAFVEEEKKVPTIVLPTNDSKDKGSSMTLSELMKLKNQNPDLDITKYL